jgi:L-lactate dehydrogenase complex protein LldG
MTKQAIIGTIQRGLLRGPLPPDEQAMLRGRLAAHPRHLIPARGQLDLEGRIALFTHYVEREFGTVARLPTLDAVPEAIATYLAAQNVAPSLAVSPHPTLQKIPFASRPLLDIRFGTASPMDAASLTHAFAGIAETGTLMLPSGPERPTLNNLLPDNAIVLLPAARITSCYEDAFDLLRTRPDDGAASAAQSESGRANFMPRNVMLVTGPSRSADIEQTLELGAHGPRRLHILIIDGEA